MDFLSTLKSEVWLTGGSRPYYLVTEFYVEEGEYDDEGVFVDGGDIWGFSHMPEMEEL